MPITDSGAVRWSDRDSEENNQRCRDDSHHRPLSGQSLAWHQARSMPDSRSLRCPRVGSEASPANRALQVSVVRRSLRPDGGVTIISTSRRVDRTARLQCSTRRRTRTLTSVTTTRQDVHEARSDRVAIRSTRRRSAALPRLRSLKRMIPRLAPGL
jgi:hypothetical protein